MKKRISLNHLRRELVRISIITMGDNVFRRCRKKNLMYERATVQYVLKSIFQYTLDDVGFLTCSGEAFHHTTIIHNVETVRNELKTYDDRVESVQKWRKLIAEISDVQINDDCRNWLIEQRDKAGESEKIIISQILNNLGYGK